jgi:hypothetical protein
MIRCRCRWSEVRPIDLRTVENVLELGLELELEDEDVLRIVKAGRFAALLEMASTLHPQRGWKRRRIMELRCWLLE